MILKKISKQQTTTLFSLNRLKVVTHYYSTGDGAAVQLMDGEQLKVVGEAGSYHDSDFSRYYTWLVGLLLYSV